MHVPVILSSALVAAAVGLPSPDQANSSAPAPQARSQEDSTRSFLSHRHAEQAQRNAKIADPANLRELNGIVRATSLVLPSPSIVHNATQLAELRDSFLVDVAQSLALLGFKAGDLRRNTTAGARLVSAAAAKVRGTATVEDEITLADTVITGTVRGTKAEDRADGFHSTVDIAVDQVIRGTGTVKPGDVVQVRRLSGPAGQGTSLRVTSEDPIPDGAKVALIGSNARYLNANAAPGAPCRLCVVEQVPLFLISGTALVPTGGYARPSSVSVLTSATK